MKDMVYSEFYPFGESHDPDFRSELVGAGIGTLSHTLVITQIVPLLCNPEEYSIRHFSTGGKHKESVERMGNEASLTGTVPLAPYLANALKACTDIGFDMADVIAEMRTRFGDAFGG
ncbi:hypothetical protein HN512_05410 [Candidatus Peregrinibacteria bacterium]|jgi:hypothetical protein|nr:hypothetical protein [Candidatus Peregrinibacteria bacterium]MBT3599242.1 hypothetical protein [Candidatus Peregrinibacteria bacterium]MBT6731136.1 hypothetical protein [Candidatus Peregrinibacteria bacterium]MBT7009001.1 hypothetical protein [Candidatus Peregrinibacteria bacterium]MBT7345193.1 hypothetical protein [Candidatus Peregrinibacteria bacterium]